MHESQSKATQHGTPVGAGESPCAFGRELATSVQAQMMPAYALGQQAPGVPLFGSTVQTKLAIGAANDPYEREADAIADHVTSDHSATASPSVSRLAPGALSQPKLEVDAARPQRGPAEEELEEESGPPTARSVAPGTPVQRQADDDEEPVQLQAEAIQSPVLEDDRERERRREEELQAARVVHHPGGGEPMADDVRAHLEERVGADLSGVRIHSGSEADEAARSLRARAFTNRNHIWLASGESPHDVRLLAHETTHVLQQGGVERRSQQTETTPPGQTQADELRAEQSHAESAVIPGAAAVSFSNSGGPAVPATTITAGTTTAAPLTAAGSGAATPATPEGAQIAGAGAITFGVPAIPVAVAFGAAAPAEAGVAPQVAPALAGPGGVAGQPQPAMEAAQPAGTVEPAQQTISAASPEAQVGSTASPAAGPEAPSAAQTASGLGGVTAAAEPSAGEAGGGGPSTEAGAGAGAEVSGGDEEAEAERTEQRMAAAAGEQEPSSDDPPEEEAPGPPPEPELQSAVAQTGEPQVTPDTSAASAMPDGEAATPETAALPSAGESGSEPTPEAAGSATHEAEPAAAADTFAGAVDGLPDVAAEPQAAEPEAASEDETPTGSAEASAGSVELPPAERDAAMAVVAEGAGGEGSGEPSGGGGGGGSAITAQPEPQTPDVSASEPSQALAGIGNLPPAQLQAALGGVNASVGNSVGQQRSALAANPPQMQRPSGSPVTRQAPITTPGAPSERARAARTQRTPEGQPVRVPEPAPLPPAPAPPTAAVVAPSVRGNAEGELSAADAAQLRSSVSRLPTHDPALDVDAGAPPRLALEGNADPARAQEQRARLEETVSEARSQGQRDVAQPMGEHEIYPTVPPETLRADVPAEGNGAGGRAGNASAAGERPSEEDQAASIIAQQRQGGEIRAAVTQAQGEMVRERQQHTERAAQAQADSQARIARSEAENSAAQDAERNQANTAVQGVRAEWTQAQQETVNARHQEANRENQRGHEDIAGEQARAETEAATHVEQGNAEAATARQRGESEAARERQRGEGESEGVLGWIAARARAFFDGIKRGIQAAFERARAAVRSAIDRAKRLAVAVIERGRQAIVAAIRRIGDALIAIGDRLLSDFPALRDRFRRAIQERVARAEAAVNRLADGLRQTVQRALDLLGAGLNAALGLLERGLLAAVNVVNRVVQGAIQFARSVVQAFAAFAVLIRDIASGPGQWLRNLGAAVVDGIRNHLWRAFKLEVKNWFNSKVEEVLGLGRTIWQVLTRGGISIARIGHMVWEGIKAAIPMVLVQLLIEKLVSMIVPAAGAVMVIIEGLQAAWGTVSRIIQAFQRFFTFLRAVKFGNAGPQFASALAAAAIVVIDFVSNWLLRRLMRPARSIGGRIRAIAQRIMQRLGRVMRRVGRGLRGVGRRLRRGFRRLSARFRRWRSRRRRGAPRRRPNQREQAQRRLDRALTALRPRIQALARRGVGGFFLRARLAAWRVWYRLTRLSMQRRGDTVRVHATINPEGDAGSLYMPTGPTLRRMVHEISRELLARPEVLEAAERMAASGAATRGSRQQISGPQGFPGAVAMYTRSGGHAPIPEGQSRSRHYQIGPPAGGLHASEHLDVRGGTNALVSGVAREPDYPAIRTALQGIMHDRNLNDQQLAAAMGGLVQTGQVPPGMMRRGQARRLSRISYLLFGREAVRNPAMAAMAPMMVSMIAQGQMTWHQALAGSTSPYGGGAFPMSMDVAPASARGLALQEQGQQTYLPGTRESRAELARREMALAEGWLRMEMQAEGMKGFADESVCRTFIRRRILYFYGLS